MRTPSEFRLGEAVHPSLLQERASEVRKDGKAIRALLSVVALPHRDSHTFQLRADRAVEENDSTVKWRNHHLVEVARGNVVQGQVGRCTDESSVCVPFSTFTTLAVSGVAFSAYWIEIDSLGLGDGEEGRAKGAGRGGRAVEVNKEEFD